MAAGWLAKLGAVAVEREIASGSGDWGGGESDGTGSTGTAQLQPVGAGERAHCLRLRCFLYLFIPFSLSSPFVFLLISFEWWISAAVMFVLNTATCGTTTDHVPWARC